MITKKLQIKELRKQLENEIQEYREGYLPLCQDKQSEDYQYWLGVCNAMNFAIIIVRGNDDRSLDT